jgi:hypothetical protein
VRVQPSGYTRMQRIQPAKKPFASHFDQ